MCGHNVVVCLLVQAPHQAKVPDLDQLLGGQQDVAGCQVPVDEPPALQVLHTRSDLGGKEPEAQQRVLVLTRAQGVV